MASRIKNTASVLLRPPISHIIALCLWWTFITIIPIKLEQRITFEGWDVLSILMLYACYSLFIVAFFLHTRVLYPKLLAKRHTTWFVISMAVTLVAFYFIFYYSFKLAGFITPSLQPEIFFKLRYKIAASPVYYGAYYFIFTIVPLLLKSLRDHYVVQNKMIRLQKEHTELELDFLKAQLNPHFMFNSLNNIYSLSLHQSTLAPEMILKLSDLMRYTLYETKDEYIALDKELAFMRDYVDLEKIRHGDHATIDIHVTGNIEGHRIAPLLLIPFIENSFKHGVNAQFGPSWIEMNVNVAADRLDFVLRNNTPNPEERKYQLNKPGGIGLVNAQKRLSLLYPSKHALNTSLKDGVYEVSLTLYLN